MDNQDYIIMLEELLEKGCVNNLLYHIQNPLLNTLTFSFEVDKYNHKNVLFIAEYIDKNNKLIKSIFRLKGDYEWTILLNHK